jgi:hypothetical protein
VVYRGADGPAEVLLFRDAEPRLELVQAPRAFNFDGDGEAFRIASEAQRIRLAHLFDPYPAQRWSSLCHRPKAAPLHPQERHRASRAKDVGRVQGMGRCV